jgi:membrane protein
MTQTANENIGDKVQRDWRALQPRLRTVWMVAKQSVLDMLTDSGPQWAASVAYYALLSAFPLLLLIVSVAAYFVDPQWAVDHLTSLLGDFAPKEDQINSVVKEAIQARGQVSLIAFGSLLWTGTRVFDALTRALNVAFNVDETYGFVKRFFVDAVMLLTIGAVFMLGVSSGYLTQLLWEALQFLPSKQGAVYTIVSLFVQVALLLLAVLLLYRYVPRGNQTWKAAAIGAVTATALLSLGSPLFQYYANRFGNYQLIYGSLGVVIIVLLWVWIGALVILFGGEVASHVQAMVIDGQSAEDVGRQHTARSPFGKRSNSSPSRFLRKTS